MKKIILNLFAALITVIHVNGQQEKIVNWINTNKITINTVNTTSNTTDLIALNKKFINKQIIAIGESTHGTKEFFQMKHRLFKYLVEEYGYTVFAIEEPYYQCSMINDYILTGNGDLKEITKGMYWCFYAEEIFDLINWMKDYNKYENNPDKKLTFFGFDSFNAQTGKLDIVNYLNKVDTKTFNEYISVLNSLSGKSSESLHSEEIKSLRVVFQTNKSDYIKSSSEKEWNHINHLITTILQYSEWINDEDLRESQMAINIDWYLNYIKPESKMFVWAHNSHISIENSDELKAMGAYLLEQYNNKYLSIGFEFDNGSFNVPTGKKIEAINLNEAPDGFLSATLRKIDTPIYFLDLKNDMPSEVDRFFYQDAKMNDYGGFIPYEDRHSINIAVGTIFDCLIFIRTTSPYKILEEGTFVK